METETKISNAAIEHELTTIKNIINPTIAMFKETKNIEDIQINLDAIQVCIDSLRPVEE